MFNMECTKVDKENKIVNLSYFFDGIEKVVIIFDFENDKSQMLGDLYNLMGYKDNENERNKYIEFLESQKLFAKNTLDGM